MAAIDLWTGIDAVRDLLETFTHSAIAIGLVRIGRSDMRNEANWRALLVTGNTAHCLWEVYCDGVDVMDTSVGGHELQLNHLYRIEAWRFRSDATSEAERQAAFELFYHVHKQLVKWSNRRIGTGQAGIMIGGDEKKSWQMKFPTNQAEPRSKVLHYRATYTAKLCNQPQESTLF